MGSAVDPANIRHELQRYHDAGVGGVHIIPIYGAKGFENKYIDYLSPKWMEMLACAVREARLLYMDVDMTTGSGWCFGGPRVTDSEANALVVHKTYRVAAGATLPEKLDRKAIQALVGFSPEGACVELTERIGDDGSVGWSPTNGIWELYAVSQRPSGQKVKRAGPGGQGHMLNLIYPDAMRHYLEWFDGAFSGYTGPMPRAMYHDSYEYRSDWSPDFFASFEQRRGYRLQTELPALFADPSRITNQASLERSARVKCDYRETISAVMAERSLPLWADWSRGHGMLTRNEAHGSPGNWLDLYAVADAPETEMFYQDRSKLVSKFASSAAHVTGKNLVAAETGTWLKEHFTETLADMKYLLDDMFLSGVNHVFYHGTCFSPDEAGWPGWHFYASYEMNPRNSIWHDVSTLNAYAARCQAVLQAGRPDNDVLLYWPIHDLWHNPKGLVRPLTVHARDWFEEQPLGKAAEALWNRGYAFDYVSDGQLLGARSHNGRIELPGGSYGAVVVPQTERMPVETMRKLLALAEGGAQVIFEHELPGDVPGWGKLAERREELGKLCSGVALTGGTTLRQATVGRGRVLAGDIPAALEAVAIAREVMFERPGLMCVRQSFDGGWFYFIANRSERVEVNGWVPLGRGAQSGLSMNPLTGESAVANLRNGASGASELYLLLQPGESALVKVYDGRDASQDSERHNRIQLHPAPVWEPCGASTQVTGTWRLTFIEGGSELPDPIRTSRLASWTELGETNAQRFAGTARYTIAFDAPSNASGQWELDLGKVCQSARLRLNGRSLGTLICPPFRAITGPLQPKNNRLEIEVTNVSANRIRDLDRRGVKWKTFYDINFVGLDYKPFDASQWPLTESGLLGPVTLRPVKPKVLDK